MAPECDNVNFADTSVRPTFNATIGIFFNFAFFKAAKKPCGFRAVSINKPTTLVSGKSNTKSKY